MPKMTRYERISIILAGVALVLAIASPFISYYWLDPQLQSFKNRGRLQVSLISDKAEKARTNLGDMADNSEVDDLAVKSWEIKIVNGGELPAKEVLIAAQYDNLAETKINAIVTPPMPTEASITNHTQFITLKRPIAPHDAVNVTFVDPPNSIWVSNEFGETSIIVLYSVDPPSFTPRPHK